MLRVQSSKFSYLRRLLTSEKKQSDALLSRRVIGSSSVQACSFVLLKVYLQLFYLENCFTSTFKCKNSCILYRELTFTFRSKRKSQNIVLQRLRSFILLFGRSKLGRNKIVSQASRHRSSTPEFYWVLFIFVRDHRLNSQGFATCLCIMIPCHCNFSFQMTSQRSCWFRNLIPGEFYPLPCKYFRLFFLSRISWPKIMHMNVSMQLFVVITE